MPASVTMPSAPAAAPPTRPRPASYELALAELGAAGAPDGGRDQLPLDAVAGRLPPRRRAAGLLPAAGCRRWSEQVKVLEDGQLQARGPRHDAGGLRRAGRCSALQPRGARAAGLGPGRRAGRPGRGHALRRCSTAASGCGRCWCWPPAEAVAGARRGRARRAAVAVELHPRLLAGARRHALHGQRRAAPRQAHRARGATARRRPCWPATPCRRWPSRC
jgi:hypothetical protein